MRWGSTTPRNTGGTWPFMRRTFAKAHRLACTSRSGAVSLNKVLEDLSVKVTGSKGQHYRSLNTSWASAAQELPDRRLQRGRLREASGEQHVRPAVLRTLLSREQRALRVMLDAVKTGTLLRAKGALSSHVAAAVEGAEAWAALRDTVLGLAAAAGQRDKAAA